MTGPPTPRPGLGARTSPEVAANSPVLPLLVVPIGSCEQHGPHLPLDTDTRIAVALSEALSEALCEALADVFTAACSTTDATSAPRGEVIVAPALAITASGEHAGFAGTLSIGTEVMTDVLVELVRSADWADAVVLVNGHGGNAAAVRRAVMQSTADGRRVLAWWPHIAGADAHAGHTETSLLLAIAPETVRIERAEVGRREHVTELIDDLRHEGVRAVSPNGVLGDPTMATAAYGHSLLSRLVADLVATVDAWWTPHP